MKGTRRWSDGFGNPQEEKPHLFPNLDFGETRETGRGRSRNERETKMIDQKPPKENLKSRRSEEVGGTKDE